MGDHTQLARGEVANGRPRPARGEVANGRPRPARGEVANGRPRPARAPGGETTPRGEVVSSPLNLPSHMGGIRELGLNWSENRNSPWCYVYKHLRAEFEICNNKKG